MGIKWKDLNESIFAKCKMSVTLGARGFSCAVSGSGFTQCSLL